MSILECNFFLMFKIDIKYNDSFIKKTTPTIYEQAIRDSIEYITNELLEAMKDEAPVRTGNLRDGHYTIIQDNMGMIANDVEYAPYVIYGTSRQAPNNYPSRVISRINTNQMQSIFQQSLITQGIL